MPSSGDCVYRLAHFLSSEIRIKVAKQVAAPAETRTPNMQRAQGSQRLRMEGWRQWRLGCENRLTQAGLLMEGDVATLRFLFAKNRHFE